MKKSIIIICASIIVLSLTAFSIINTSHAEKETEVSEKKELAVNLENKQTQPINLDFVHDVGPRFWPIKKEDLLLATSIKDFISPEVYYSINHLKSVNVIIIENEQQTSRQEIGYTEALTPGQLKLFKEIDYDTQFNIRAEFTQINKETGNVEDNYDSPHISVVPETQATYNNGKKELIDFLRKESLAFLAKEKAEIKNIKPTKMRFTVTKDGKVKNVKLDKKSIYPNVDAMMIELIQNTPENWMPAENSKGKKVDQTLFITFGFSMGC